MMDLLVEHAGLVRFMTGFAFMGLVVFPASIWISAKYSK